MKSALSKACTIKIKEFEGPFDLLFYLFEKNKINIYDIPISDITDQYIDYLAGMKKLDLEIASEFLLIAATLVHIKSKMLLPKQKKEEKKDENDPREDLVIKLVEYKKFKNIANVLKEKNENWDKVYYKPSENFNFKYEPIIYDMNPNELSESYYKVLVKKKKKENQGAKNITHILKTEKVSMKKMMKSVIQAMLEKTVISFKEVFSFKVNTKMEVITGFLSVLELVKIKKLRIEQEDNFEDIKLYRQFNNLDEIDEEIIEEDLEMYD